MAINTGDLLMGLGAAVGGTGPQFIQGLQQREQALTEQKRAELQARQQAMYQDAATGLQLLSQGDLDGLIALGEDRLQLLQTFPDADPSDTQRIVQNARLAKQGDPVALRNLATELTSATSRGLAMGIVKLPESQKGVVVDGSVINPVTGDVIYQGAAKPAAPLTEIGKINLALQNNEITQEQANAMLAQISKTPADEFSPGITRYRNGVAVQYSRQGAVRVVDEQGRVVTGPDAQAAINRGIESGVTEAGQIAVSQAQGKGATERAQSIINAGVDSIAQFPVITRTLELLNEVKTGGFANLAMRAKSMFGVEGADEGELSYNLAMNVLQQLKPIFGSAFTAGEGERLQRIEASFGRSNETNIRLLNQALRLAQTSAEKALDRADESGDESTARELRNALDALEQFSLDEIPMPESWANSGGTLEAWNSLTKEQKRQYNEAPE